MGRDGCEGGLKQYVWDWVIKTQHVTRLASYPYKGNVSSHLVFISSCLVDWVATSTLLFCPLDIEISKVDIKNMDGVNISSL